MTLLIVSLRGEERRSNPDPTMQPDRTLRPLDLDHSGDTLCDIIQRSILARPFAAGHPLAIARQGLQLGKVATLPEARAQSDRDHSCRPSFASVAGFV
jgi:hypothetical protein